MCNQLADCGAACPDPRTIKDYSHPVSQEITLQDVRYCTELRSGKFRIVIIVNGVAQRTRFPSKRLDGAGSNERLP
jgi:hypothetical protein